MAGLGLPVSHVSVFTSTRYRAIRFQPAFCASFARQWSVGYNPVHGIFRVSRTLYSASGEKHPEKLRTACVRLMSCRHHCVVEGSRTTVSWDSGRAGTVAGSFCDWRGVDILRLMCDLFLFSAVLSVVSLFHSVAVRPMRAAGFMSSMYHSGHCGTAHCARIHFRSACFPKTVFVWRQKYILGQRLDPRSSPDSGVEPGPDPRAVWVHP